MVIVVIIVVHFCFVDVVNIPKKGKMGQESDKGRLAKLHIANQTL